jgi:deazaflavin-dependent oxidoreductase (nitroreductase family)
VADVPGRSVLWILAMFAAAGALVFAWTRLPVTVWYRDQRPTRFGKLTNRWMGRFASLGVPSYAMETLEVPGRKSGRTTSTVLVVAHHEGEEYLVSMLGKNADWVRNVAAAGGEAVLRHGGRRPVHLAEVPVEERAPILRTYLRAAPGARPHIPVAVDASDEALAEVAPEFPVFRVTARTAAAPRT